MMSGFQLIADEMPAFTPETFPRISASTAYQPIVMQLTGKALHLAVREGRPQYDTRERCWEPVQPDLPAWEAKNFAGYTLRERVRHHKTHAAGLMVIRGEVDMAIIPEPGPELMDAAAEAGVVLRAVPISREALIFLVSTQNPVPDVPAEKVRQLYAGETVTWQELHEVAPDVPVSALIRNPTSGSHVLLRNTFMGETPVSETLDQYVVTHMMGAVLDRVADDPRTLGYSIFTYHQGMARPETGDEQQVVSKSGRPRRATQPLGLDGVQPSLETISDGRYPYSAPIVALTRADIPEDHAVRRLQLWLAGEAGQAWMQSIGFPPAHLTDPPEDDDGD